MIGLPPLAGAVHVTVALALPAAALTPVGAEGAVCVPAGVTAFEAEEGGPVPIALVAATVNVYVVPLTRPLIATLVAGGEPETVVVVCGVAPTMGVTV